MHKQQKLVIIIGGLSVIVTILLCLTLFKSGFENSVASSKNDSGVYDTEDKEVSTSSESNIVLKDNDLVPLELLIQKQWKIDGGPILSFKPNGEILAAYSSGQTEVYGSYKYENDIIEFEYNIHQELSEGKEFVRDYSPIWKTGKMELVPQDSERNVEERTLKLSPSNV
ncbi:hypothetical protein [Enterococcus rotai]|uniref:hypothetical protein n=1 Tax=Enterococcus rotai TaxID=118060 RepID=UPI0035C69F3F